ncbi:hypothetical protein [Prosthecodimorpha staleyi]|uniref:Uncharacterized protein n=1 Tax=Prosthecodimorpha staleyi TaxID=2840188 RepID=A0A947GDF6_9HYPH|nr:hypothetical protein [Prosthecodimorpha staleyi]MBT9290241.1 hypothetical protein [Prosthecodimorpha staleyi]
MYDFTHHRMPVERDDEARNRTGKRREFPHHEAAVFLRIVLRIDKDIEACANVFAIPDDVERMETNATTPRDLRDKSIAMFWYPWHIQKYWQFTRFRAGPEF